MSIAQFSLAEILWEHVMLEVESIDRMYLNVYIPKLQQESGASWFLRQERKYPVPSSAAMAPISLAFVEAIESYATGHQIPMLSFAKGQRKDDVVAPYILTEPLGRLSARRAICKISHIRHIAGMVLGISALAGRAGS